MVFVPSLGTTDVMLQVDALTNFTQQALQDSQKAISALNAEQIQIQIRNVALQNRLALFLKLQKEELMPLFIPSAVHIYLI